MIYIPKVERVLMRENFSRGSFGTPFPANVLIQKPTGHNLVVVKSGNLYVKEGSAADKAISRLLSGCGRIDCVKCQKSKTYMLCFRDKKVKLSEYLLTSDFDETLIIPDEE